MAACTECPPVTTSAKVLCPEHIGRDFSPAVVGIKCIPRFRVFWENFSRWIEEVNGATHYNAGILPMSSTGFFTEKGYIVSTSSFTSILTIASLVMTFSAPFCWQPGTNGVVHDIPAFATERDQPDPSTHFINRYHDLDGFVAVLEELCNGGCFADWFEWYVDITKTNKTGRCAATYRAVLCGVDFETGLAWFRVRNGDAWNRCLDPIVRQTVLKFGNSKRAHPGSVVHTLYDSRVTGPQSMATGVVSDNTGMLRDGGVPYEVITTDLLVGEGAEGAPILNACGQVVGIIVGVTSFNTAVGITSAFMERIHNAIVEANCTPNCGPHAVYIASFGCYLYRHGTLDLSYHLKTATDLNQALLSTAIGNGDCTGCKAVSGTCGACRGRTEDYWRNEFYNYESCRINREIIGIVVDRNPTGVLGQAVEECAIRDPNFGQVQRRFFQIQKGDIITHINGMPLGARVGQQSPENIFYSLDACTCVTLTFLKEHEIYSQEHSISVELEDNLLWIPDFVPCCMPCLKYDPVSVYDSFANFLCACTCAAGMSIPFKGLPVHAVPAWKELLPLVENIGELLSALQCWFNLITWFMNALPAVYRSSFYSNVTELMTHLNEWVALLSAPQPIAAQCNGVPLFTPLSIGATLAQLSRISVTTLAKPSIESSVRPIPFFDYIASIPHPHNSRAFAQSVPNYLALIGCKATQYFTAHSNHVAASHVAAHAASGVFAEPFAFPASQKDIAAEIAASQKRAAKVHAAAPKNAKETAAAPPAQSKRRPADVKVEEEDVAPVADIPPAVKKAKVAEKKAPAVGENKPEPEPEAASA